MKQQQGFVLIFTVILLFVAAILGLYAMRSTVIQDKMTANINNKTITSNAAEDGTAAFLTWAKNRFTNNGWPTSANDKNAWSSSVPNTASGTLSANSGSNGYYWIDPTSTIAGCASTSTNPCWDDTKKTVTVQVTGYLIKTSGSNTSILGKSIYQLKLTAPGGGGLKLPQLPAPLTLAGNVLAFQAGNSNQFKIQGVDRLAVATANQSSANVVLNAIPNNRSDSEHYGGGSLCATGACVAMADLGIWGNANQLMSYIDTISNSANVTVYNGDFSGKLPFCAGIVIVKGNMDVNGNISGTGCNNAFRGAIIVLGGSLDVSGGGALDISGAVYVAKISGSAGNYSFVDNPSGFKGGGNMTITYDGSYFGTSSDITGASTGTSQTEINSWNSVL